MGLALWQYVVIIIASEIVLVALILLCVWQYCKWAVRNGHRERSDEKPPLVPLSDEDMLNDLFSNKAVVEYGQPPSNPGSFRINDFPKPIRRPLMMKHLPSVSENTPAIEMSNLPPAYASREVSYISLNSKARGSSAETAGDESSDWLDTQFPVRLSVTPVESDDDRSVPIVRPQMRKQSPLPESGTNDRHVDGDNTDKVSGRVRFETLWLPGKNRKKNKVTDN
ncbi:uncharacterized protein LOC110449128 isoform X2 [Mizuhopecten yessoensis]|uniref:uncharacterized protein LOC110449128 isoform X2 n=1 Tax=Mizuhopecten yessoensis TaxID=6573 RepID=UPI000B45C3F6|nr:uncharacterized protein LOC110449128 isoform X2 [Mizuhopecten yessoensis]